MSTTWPDRIFYDERNDQIIYVKQNPCGCHPWDLLVEWSMRFGGARSYRFDNDSEIEEFLERWIEL